MASLSDYCRNGQEIWLTVIPLICFHIVEWHYPNRVLRQFGMRQMVLPYCDTGMELHQLDLRGKHDHNWRQHHATFISLWRACRDNCVLGDIVDIPAVSDDYLHWYDSITRRYITREGAYYACTIIEVNPKSAAAHPLSRVSLFFLAFTAADLFSLSSVLLRTRRISLSLSFSSTATRGVSAPHPRGRSSGRSSDYAAPPAISFHLRRSNIDSFFPSRSVQCISPIRHRDFLEFFGATSAHAIPARKHIVLAFSSVRIGPRIRSGFVFRGTNLLWVALAESHKLTMQNLHHLIYRLSSTSLGKSTNTSRLLKENVGSNLILDSVSTLKHAQGAWLTSLKEFSAKSGGFDEGDAKNEWDRSVSESFSGTTSDDLGWDSVSSWSTGLTKEHFDGEAVGRRTSGGGDSPKSPQSSLVSGLQEIEDRIREIDAENRKNEGFMDKWGERMREMSMLLKQVREPGARGSYLKDSEKAEMYRLHKENPEVYTVEKLAKDYRIMRQRVHAILWLKELEEEEEKKLGHPLDDSVELLLGTCPEFFKSHDREFHVASLPYKPDFKVMPEGWDGTTRDLDEVHYEISQKEDDMLYKEFVEKMNFNKKKIAGEVFRHKYSRRRAADGWKFTIEKMGPRGKRGGGGGWKFVSLPDGSSRPLNEMEKMYVRRETPRHRRKILP